MLICPGGGYSFISPREAEPIALKFAAEGYHAFVLYYSIYPTNFPQPFYDISRAMCLIRENAEKWNIHKDSIAVCGFSAGAHLAGTLGVHWNKDFASDQDGISPGMNRPNALILCYPVISSKYYVHTGSYEKLIGSKPSQELLDLMSLENHVGPHTPKTFLWHTFEDIGVPVGNSILFAEALKRNNVNFELHIYPYGGHGLSLASDETSTDDLQPDTHIATWFDLCVEWLDIEFDSIAKNR